jgi:hypothetical protein
LSRNSRQESTMPLQNSDAETPPPPWWRLPIVWLVIGGPLLVVVASFATLALAIRYPDPVLTTPKARTSAETPAMEARNHAATPAP